MRSCGCARLLVARWARVGPVCAATWLTAHGGALDGFSGGSVFANGKREDYDGDIWFYVNRPNDGYSFRAGDRAAWRFDSRGFLDAIDDAGPKGYVHSNRFVTRIR